jgi:outer membrane protein assembly factor BamB
MRYITIFAGLAACGIVPGVAPADSPQWGGSPARNNVSDAKNIPTEWKVGQFEEKTGKWLGQGAENIRWVARLGSESYGSPVVAGGKVFSATNNGAAYLPRYPKKIDLGCLLCFGQADGRFLWQLSCEKLAAGAAVDYPKQGLCCGPLVEGKRLWTITNRCEVVCLDTEGNPATPGEARPLWSYDMIRQLGVAPHNMSSCSVTAAGDLLLVVTGNGVDEKTHSQVPAPQAPSFIALDKTTGKLLWADNSPGANIIHGQWGSPAYAVIGGVPQAIFPGGDGWLYSFLAKPAGGGKPELLWKFDCNPKRSVWKLDGNCDRNTLVATPVIVGSYVYLAVGDDPTLGQGTGHLWCIDATKRGDVSPELVFDKAGKPVPPRRTQAADTAAGEVVRPNPNSAAVWHYVGAARKGAGEPQFKDTMHRTLSMAAVKDGLLVIPDLAGLVHCLDAKTGKVHWTHDTLAAIWGSPLIVEDRVYLGCEGGEMFVLALSPTLKVLAKNEMGSAVFTTPVATDGVLYVATQTHLVAIAKEKE